MPYELPVRATLSYSPPAIHQVHDRVHLKAQTAELVTRRTPWNTEYCIYRGADRFSRMYNAHKSHRLNVYLTTRGSRLRINLHLTNWQHSYFACRSCENVDYTFSGGRNSVPIRAISNDQSLFPTLPSVAQKHFNYLIYLNPRLFRPVFVSQNPLRLLFSQSHDSNASTSHPSISPIHS